MVELGNESKQRIGVLTLQFFALHIRRSIAVVKSSNAEPKNTHSISSRRMITKRCYRKVHTQTDGQKIRK